MHVRVGVNRVNKMKGRSRPRHAAKSLEHIFQRTPKIFTPVGGHENERILGGPIHHGGEVFL